MADDGNVTSLIEKLGRTFEEFKATNNAAIEDLRKGKTDPIVTEKLAKIDAELDKLSDIQTSIENATTIAKNAQTTAVEAAKVALRPGPSGRDPDSDPEKRSKLFGLHRRAERRARGMADTQDPTTEEYAAYREIFSDLLRKGSQSLDLDRKAMQTGVDADGGFLVPPDMSGQMVTRIYDSSPMRQIASVTTISTDRLEGLLDVDVAGSGGWVAETQARPETSTPQIGMWNIPVHEMYANPAATQRMIDDSAIDIEAWLNNKVAERFARDENNAFVVGNGVGKPRGFANYPTSALPDSTRPWGTIEAVKTGVNGAFAASNPSDILFDLMGAFKEGYLSNARWVTRRSAITLIRKFRDGQGQYVWIPGLLQGATETLLGFPITKFEDLPALSTFGNSLWFGDFRRGYQIVDRLGIRVLRDPYTNKPFVHFYTTKRVGGDVINTEVIKTITFAA